MLAPLGSTTTLRSGSLLDEMLAVMVRAHVRFIALFSSFGVDVCALGCLSVSENDFFGRGVVLSAETDLLPGGVAVNQV